ncbi:hypothetical protein AB833_09255 [Chromatiales bacterium (ex Bugula neritina AB1)]|nr:hypothetical protein AB833_09255 [Chromatiales bacterium (ex Bugula neritina AB1)]
MQPDIIERVQELVTEYRYFLVDQFGVLHNGFTAYPGAAEALRQLKGMGAVIVIISNSGKRADLNKTRLSNLGFTPDCYDDLVSSGEVAWNLLNSEYIGSRLTRSARCYLLSNNNDRSALEGLDLTVVENIEEAEVILLSGQHLNEKGLAALCQRLQSAVKSGVPCFCTNPDKIAYAESGKVFSSGTVAQWYEEQGGEVIWLGKPYPEIYQYVLKQYNITDKSQVICVGDSIEHDIKGGVIQGLSTVLVRSGILDDLDDNQITNLYQRHSATPDYVIPEFI